MTKVVIRSKKQWEIDDSICHVEISIRNSATMHQTPGTPPYDPTLPSLLAPRSGHALLKDTISRSLGARAGTAVVATYGSQPTRSRGLVKGPGVSRLDVIKDVHGQGGPLGWVLWRSGCGVAAGVVFIQLVGLS